MEASELNALGHEKSPLLKVIRAKCLDCCIYQPTEVRKCTAFKCALWPYRLSKNPFSEREASPAEMEALARLRAVRKGLSAPTREVSEVRGRLRRMT